MKTKHMKTFGKVIGVLLLLWIIYRPVTHFFCLPWAVHSSWVEPVRRAMDFGFPGGGEIFTGGMKVREQYGARLDPIYKASEMKQRFYATLKARKGKMGLSRRLSTAEGQPIFDWLLVQDGKLTYVKDSSGDNGAPPWAVSTHTPLEFKLGFFRSHKFVEGEPTSTDSPIIVFQMLIHKYGDKDYFY